MTPTTDTHEAGLGALLPCPFCGSNELMLFCDPEEGRDNSGPSRRVQCADCHIEAPFYDTEAEAVAVWNTRAALARTPDTEREAIARLIEQHVKPEWTYKEDCYLDGVEDAADAIIAAGYTRTPPEQPSPHPPRTDGGAEFAWPEWNWTCPDCNCRSWARFDVPRKGGGYMKGEGVRCVHCKREHYPPAIARRRCADAPAGGEALREALEPFAAKLVDVGESETDDDHFSNGRTYNHAPSITVGHIRRAHEALLATPQQESPDAQG